MSLLSIVKNKAAPDPGAMQRPHVQALRENLAFIAATRELLNAVHVKDRAALADIALCEATQAQMQSIAQEIDSLRAESVYSDAPPPDVRAQEKKLLSLQQTLKRQQDVARAATLIRAKYAADIQKLGLQIQERASETDRLTWDAAYEDVLGALAPEFLELEERSLKLRQRVFSACALCDSLARENGYGQFTGAALGADFRIPRPSHPAYDDHLTPEQSYAQRRAYLASIAEGAQALVRELRGSEA